MREVGIVQLGHIAGRGAKIIIGGIQYMDYVQDQTGNVQTFSWNMLIGVP